MVSDDRISDLDIRPALHTMLRQRHADEVHTVFIEELGICQGRTRIDIAVVNRELHGYEIKSDRDSLRRLPIQVKMYSKVVSKATIVVGYRHLAESLAAIPSWWGVLQVEWGSSGVKFKTVRRESSNPEIEARSLVELLWRDDAIDLLEQRGMAHGVRSKPRHMVWDRICERIELDEIAAAARERLRARVMSPVPPQL